MKLPFELKPRISRKSTFFAPDSPEVPAALFQNEAVCPDLSDFPLPLPSKKSDYVCSAVTEDGARWFGGLSGITRYDSSAEFEVDKVMYFAFERDLPDNNVKNLLAEGNGVWALTENGVAKIEMVTVSALEKAEILTEETKKYVQRRGMVSQKRLGKRGDLSSALPYAESDNDGTFTVGFAVGEVFKYAFYKREKGADAPETLAAKASAVEAIEACLLLMHIPGRGDGFVARSYHLPTEPVPDDGFFYVKKGDKAYCAETTASKRRGIVGLECNASAPVPERLAKLYKDAGCDGEGIVYKADTSSDEITHHYWLLWLAHDLLGEDDPELDALMIDTAKGLTAHIIDNGFVLRDCTGKPTTWARWDEEYFNSDAGYVDACLNAAELLMYLQVTMHISGEQGRWRKTYDELVAKGYAALSAKHYDRMVQATLSMGVDYVEDIMYGDHMLALCSYWGLCRLETDEDLLKYYRKGFQSWRSSMAREHNPAYDFPYALCTGEEIDMPKIADWFQRHNLSRLASRVSLTGRHDMPVIRHKGDYKETGFLAQADERFISKYDRNPLEYKDEDSGGAMTCESCYVYTCAYWMGRYYGFID